MMAISEWSGYGCDVSSSGLRASTSYEIISHFLLVVCMFVFRILLERR